LIGLITKEELAALLDDKFVVTDQVVQKINNENNSKAAQPQIRMPLIASTPALSLRDLISTEEIAALLACFPIEDRKSNPKIVRKACTCKKIQSKYF
jgi:hypothetical protein